MELKLWPLLRNTTWLQDIIGDPRGAEYWRKIFDNLHAKSSNTNIWDYQFLFACWVQNGLAISPTTNLVSNIGFRADATHTKSADDSCGNIPAAEMKFPLKHPPYMVRDREADQFHLDQALNAQILTKRCLLILSRMVPRKLSDIIRRIDQKIIGGSHDAHFT
jgi:hypothetical protein